MRQAAIIVLLSNASWLASNRTRWNALLDHDIRDKRFNRKASPQAAILQSRLIPFDAESEMR
jgi:hypothetical protein